MYVFILTILPEYGVLEFNLYPLPLPPPPTLIFIIPFQIPHLYHTYIYLAIGSYLFVMFIINIIVA